MSDPKDPDKDLRLEDVDKWDRQAIREASVKLFLERKDTPAVDCAIESVFNYLHTRGMKIVRDETKEDTRSRPNKSWYAPFVAKRDPYK